jgi:hypothetical protein
VDRFHGVWPDGHYEAFSPTANGEAAVGGSDQSFCLLRAWDHSEPKSHKVFGVPPHFITAKCCGAVTVQTVVQDEGEEGSEYDPDEVWKALVADAKGLHDKYGGGPLKAPGPFGASKRIGYWFANESHVAVAGYQVNDGFVEIEVEAHTDPYKKLEALAQHIVPAFEPYG